MRPPLPPRTPPDLRTPADRRTPHDLRTPPDRRTPHDVRPRAARGAPSGRAGIGLLVAATLGFALLGLAVLWLLFTETAADERVAFVAPVAERAAGAVAGHTLAAGRGEDEIVPLPAVVPPLAAEAPSREAIASRRKPYVVSRWPIGASSASLAVVALDGADHPVGGARVELLEPKPDGSAMLDLVLELLTDEHGLVHVPAPGARASLRVSFAGVGCSGVVALLPFAEIAGEPAVLVVPLLPEFHVRGRALLADGRPAPGATIAVQAASYDTRPSHVPLPRVSDSEGRFTLDGHAGDDLIVRAESAAGAGDWIGLRDPPPEGEPLLLRLPAAFRLGGVALRDDGTPLPRATILFLPDAGQSAMLEASLRRFVDEGVPLITGRDGRFALEFVQPGRGVLWSLSPDCALDAPMKVTIPPDGAPVEVVLRAPIASPGEPPSARAIAGRVVDEAGNPMVGADVTAEWGPDDAFPEQARTLHAARADTITNAEGRFRLFGLAPGRSYDVLAHSGIQQSTWRHLEPAVPTGTEELELVIRANDWPEAAIELRVVSDADGAPLRSGVVNVVARQPVRRDFRNWSLSIADDSGARRIVGLYPGTGYDLIVEAEGFATEITEACIASAVPEPITVRLQRTALLTCRIVGTKGPVTWVTVDAECLDGPRTPWITGLQRSERTDADGVLRLAGLRPGRWRLVVTRDGRSSSITATVTPGGTTEVTLDLR